MQFLLGVFVGFGPAIIVGLNAGSFEAWGWSEAQIGLLFMSLLFGWPAFLSGLGGYFNRAPDVEDETVIRSRGFTRDEKLLTPSTSIHYQTFTDDISSGDLYDDDR